LCAENLLTALAASCGISRKRVLLITQQIDEAVFLLIEHENWSELRKSQWGR